jgi:hypothetical protein
MINKHAIYEKLYKAPHPPKKKRKKRQPQRKDGKELILIINAHNVSIRTDYWSNFEC